MFINTEAVRFVVLPEPVVDIAVHVDEPSLTVCSIFAPLSDILSTIRPGLFSVAVSEAALPLSSIYSSSFKLIGWLLLSFLVRVVNLLGHCFP